MGNTRALLLAGAMAFGMAGAALAADLPPPPVYVPPPEPVAYGGWYLRGDVGVGIAQGADIRSSFYDGSYAPLDAAGLANAVPGFSRVSQHIGDAAFVDAGIGYQFNNWFRMDVTGEYRTGQQFNTLESYDVGANAKYNQPGQYFGYDKYNGNVQSSVFLVNGWLDLFTYYGITGSIGAGVGASYNSLSSITDLGVGGPTITYTAYDAAGNPYQATDGGIGNGGFGYSKAVGKFSLAYAGMAALSYAITPHVKVELGYRYLNMGDIQSSFINCVNATGCVVEKQKLNLASQDIRLGLRWMIDDYAAAPVPAPMYVPQAPIIRKD